MYEFSQVAGVDQPKGRLWLGRGMTLHLEMDTHLSGTGAGGMIFALRDFGWFLPTPGDVHHTRSVTYWGAPRYVSLLEIVDPDPWPAGVSMSIDATISVTGGTGCGPALGVEENFGPNPALPHQRPTQGTAGDPVDTRTGNFHYDLPGLFPPSRDLGFGFSVGYNALAASSAEDVGHGWFSSLAMNLTVKPDGSAVVVQEGGSTVSFAPTSEGGFLAPPRFSATLVHNADGTYTFTRNHLERFVFAADGRLVSTGALGEGAVTYHYPAGSDEVDYLTDSAGQVLDVTWAGGRVVELSASGAGGPFTIQLGYDGAGDLVSYQDVEGDVWQFTYDHHRLTELRKPRFTNTPTKLSTHYDGWGRVDKQTTAAGLTITFEYMDSSTRTRYSDGLIRDDVFSGDRRMSTRLYGTTEGGTTSWTYDDDTLAVTSAKDPSDHVTQFVNDARGNPTKITDPSGRVTRISYNAFEQPTRVEVGETAAPLSVSTAAVVATEYTYDSVGRLVSATQAAGTADESTTTLVRGDAAHPADVTAIVDGRAKTWAISHDPVTGLMSGLTDPLGHATTVTMDGLGRPLSVTSPRQGVTTWTYDAPSRSVTVTDPAGLQARIIRDANGNVVSSAVGITPQNPGGDVTTYAYDSADRVVSVDEPGPGARSMTYKPAGQLETTTNETGGIWRYGYDGLRRLVTATDPTDGVTRYRWSLGDRLTSVAQPGADSSCTTAPLKNCTTYSYDPAGRLTSVDYADPATPDVTGITYDELGRRTSAIQGSRTESWTWDQLSRLVGHGDGNGRSTAFGWDDTSNLVSITYPGKSTPLTRTFDDAGRLTAVTDWTGRTTSFGYDEADNWTQTVFPTGTNNVDVRAYDAANRLSSITWKRGATVLGSLTYARDPKAQIASVTGAGAGSSQAWSYDTRQRVTGSGTETFGVDDAGNIVNDNGVLQVYDPAQRLCWTSPTATSGDCSAPAADATTYAYDARGNRTQATQPSGTRSRYTYDAANRMTSAAVPSVSDPNSRQFQNLAGGAVRIADTTDGTGICNGAPCARLAAATPVAVTVAGSGGVPASGAIAVTGTLTVTAPAGDGWLQVNPNGDAAAAAVPLAVGEQVTTSFAAKLDANGRISLTSDVAADVAVDISGFYTAPSPWVPALDYWPIAPVVAASSANGTGTCDGQPCGTLPSGVTKVKVSGVGAVPTSGVSAVSVLVIGQSSGAGRLRVAPNGEASAGDISWDASFPQASGNFTVPVNPDGTIDIDVSSPTSVTISVSGYWRQPSVQDTGLGLELLDGAQRLVDTRDGTGTCNGVPCSQIPATTALPIAVAGRVGLPADATAVMISVNLIDPAGPGLFSIGATAGAASGGFVFDAGEDAHATMIVPIDPATGDVSVTSWAATDLTIDVIGYFRYPTTTWTYSYDPSGLRASKQRSASNPNGYDQRFEYTWQVAARTPTLLAEHRGSETSYLVYGPGDTPIYQVMATGTPIYLHQDHLGSTRLVTNADGSVRGTQTYDTSGRPLTNTNPWLQEQAIPGFAGQYQDNETGYTYLRNRYYDPGTTQFTTRSPLAVAGANPYTYAATNPVNRISPNGVTVASSGSSSGGYPGLGTPPALAPSGRVTWDRTLGPIVSTANDACFENWTDAAVCAGVAAAAVGLGLGVGAVLGYGGGLTGVAGTTSSLLGWAATAVQVALTVADCRHGVDGSCVVNAIGAALGVAGSGLGSLGGRFAESLTFLDLAAPAAILGSAISVGAFIFGLSPVTAYADRRTRDEC